MNGRHSLLPGWHNLPEHVAWPRPPFPYLILELLAELQGDGEEDEGVIEPWDHRLHLVHVAHLQTLGTPLTEGRGEGS